MQITTSHFGSVAIEADDVIRFPAGLLGLDGGTDWVMLADAENEALGWLQSTTRPEMALAVVSPRRFVEDYQARVTRSELAALELEDPDQAHVLVIVSTGEQGATLNLKAPLMINFERRLGRQVIATGDLPLQYELGRKSTTRRMAA